jgi:VanZ family protein
MPSRRHDLLAVHLPAAAWLVAMTIALAVPSNVADLPAWWPRILHFQALDKVVHVLLFAVAALLLARSFRRLPGVERPLLAALLATSLYGGATEIGQHLFTGRQGEVADVAADVAGSAAGSLLAWLLARHRGWGAA